MYMRLKNLKQRDSREGGFTLIELLVVIAIIGLLAGIVVSSLNSARVRARDSKRISDFRQIQGALELFYDQTGQYPVPSVAGNWSDVWARLANCLQSGAECGFAPANFTSVMNKVPQDPLFVTGATEPTYFYAAGSGIGAGCNGQQYRLAVFLETSNNSAFQSDVDGSFYQDNNGCRDAPERGYCLGAGICGGW